MSVKNKAILLVSLIIVSLFAFSLYHVVILYNRSIDAQTSDAKKNLATIVNDVELYSFTPYKSRIKGIWKTDPRIVEALVNLDRDRLYRIVRPKFDTLVRENSYFAEMRFLRPDGATLLSLQADQEESAEGAKRVSPSMQAVQRHKVFLAAFEAGKGGVFFRLIEPIQSQGRYVGALEFGIRLEQMVDALRKQLKAPVTFYLSTAMWPQWLEEQTTPFSAVGDTLVATGDDALLEGVADLIDYSVNEQRLVINGETYVAHLFPILKDHRGVANGGMLVLQDITGPLRDKKLFVVRVTLFALALLAIAMGLLYFSFGELIGKLELSQRRQEDLLVKLQGEVQERRQAGERLTASNQRFTTVMEKLAAAVFVIDLATHEVVFANTFVRQIFGDAVGRPCWQIFMPDQSEPCSFCPGPALLDEKNEPTGEVYTWEYYHATLDRWFELHEQAIRWVDGRVVHLKIATDITFRKNAEVELVKNRDRLTRAQAIAHLGYWEWDLPSGHCDWSEETFNILGLSSGRHSPCHESLFGAIPVDERADVETALAKALQESEAPFSIDHRIVRPDGSERIVHQEAEVVYDQNNEPVKILGTVLDVTQVRETSKQLLLSANVFENSIEGILITDAVSIIQMVNRAFTEITGFGSREAVGETPALLKSNLHDAIFYQSMWKTLLAEGHWQGEILNRRKNGEVYPQWTTISAIRDAAGKVTNYVAVFHDMSEIKQREEELQYQAQHDALTNLPNRLLFNDRLTVAMGHAKRQRQLLAVLFFDLDNFKNVNDSLGHTVGDALLIEVAERLSATVRHDDTVARYGGDEFIIMLEGLRHDEDAVAVARMITEAIREPFTTAGRELYVTCSVGISIFPTDGHDPESLIMNADMAMYRAKDIGKNNYQVFTREMNKRVVKRLAMENSFRKAMENKEFLVHYQPKIDLDTGLIVGAEALVRWQPPEGLLVPPLDFIPMAEETGLIIPLGEWVLRHVCEQVRRWQGLGYPLRVAVNLSLYQFRQQHLPEMIGQVLADTGLEAESLDLEVTESTLMDNEERVIRTLRELKEMGVGLAIDDFGTGYSSLSYLKRLPIKTIKIDRSFVRDIPHDKEDVAITSAIISMAHSLKLDMVAEGVETPVQAEFLHSRGCRQVQGYLYSPPVSAERLLAMLQEGARFPVPGDRAPAQTIFVSGNS